MPVGEDLIIFSMRIASKDVHLTLSQYYKVVRGELEISIPLFSKVVSLSLACREKERTYCSLPKSLDVLLYIWLTSSAEPKDRGLWPASFWRLTPCCLPCIGVQFSHLSSVTVFLLLCQCSQTKNFVEFYVDDFSVLYEVTLYSLESALSHCCLTLQKVTVYHKSYQAQPIRCEISSWISWKSACVKLKHTRNMASLKMTAKPSKVLARGQNLLYRKPQISPPTVFPCLSWVSDFRAIIMSPHGAHGSLVRRSS